MAVSWVSGNTHVMPNLSTSVDPNALGTVQGGDFLIFFASHGGSASTFGTPTGITGWTLLDQRATASSTFGVWYKFAAGSVGTTSSDSGGTVSTAFAGTSGRALGLIGAYRGVDPGNPIAGWAVSTASGSGSHVFPSASTNGVDLAWLLYLFAEKSTTTTAFGNPGGYTQRLTDGIGSAATGQSDGEWLDSNAGKTPSGTYGGDTITTTGATSSNDAKYTILLAPAVSNPQILVPVSDVTTSGWTFFGSASAFGALDETTPDDADYVVSPPLPSSSVIEVGVAAGADPLSSSGHQFSYRLKSGDASTSSVTAALVQGATVISSETRNPVPSTFTTYTKTLSGAEADAITNYADLRLRFTATAT